MTQSTITRPRLPAPAEVSTEVIASGSIGRQGTRFFLIGSAGTGLQLGLYAASALLLGAQIASIFSWLISTTVTNATHRALTFDVHGTSRNRSDQVAAFATCLIGLAITSVVLAEVPNAAGLTGVVAILVVNTVVGAGRFVGMRWWLGGSGRRIATQIGYAVTAARSSWRLGGGMPGLHH